jgi:ribonuclease P protein component
LIDSIRDRDVFVRLGRDGRRFRRDPLWCTYLPQPGTTGPSVAFAIGRNVGPAVVRNRLRRRLRSIVRARDLPGGFWLIGTRPGSAELTFDELTTRIDDIVAAVSRARL